ncbi:hypothetical protein BDDG_13935 [Blastomyces dermatitidis ATCC 18188]|uniref:Uncharacterized protein n=1 Tax=Ajellomyces dermatitidis (strain ATCC 18188 / CBS 674.68) TaxID=653446 RepID=A0A0J9EXA5_AJEDA|nr:hypothetical protein BDDG_13935 [Blastomyces dermatitidis ATCC 18188]
MGQIGKGGTRVRLGVGVLEHQRWTGVFAEVAPSDISTTTGRGSSKIEKIGAYG